MLRLAAAPPLQTIVPVREVGACSMDVEQMLLKSLCSWLASPSIAGIGALICHGHRAAIWLQLPVHIRDMDCGPPLTAPPGLLELPVGDGVQGHPPDPFGKRLLLLPRLQRHACC